MCVLLMVLLSGWASLAFAQEKVPDLRGTWVGTAKAIVFGNNGYLPGSQTPFDPPRVNEQEYTLEIAGQDGRVLWGKAWATANPDVRDTQALAIAADVKTIVAADSAS